MDAVIPILTLGVSKVAPEPKEPAIDVSDGVVI